MEIIKCKDAKKKGLTRYFTGKFCKYNHLSERYVSNHRCIVCLEENKEHILEIKRKSSKKSYLKNNEREIIRSREFRKNFPEKAKATRQKRQPQRNFSSAKRNAIKLKALVKWADLNKIKEIYLNCPKDMTVDHILPLLGKLICGLHLESNLQYLSRDENTRKNNKFNPYFQIKNEITKI